MAPLCCATWWLPARNREGGREGGGEGESVAHVSALALGLVPCDRRKEEEQEEVEEEDGRRSRRPTEGCDFLH